jgi:peroxiredoxin
VGVKSQRDFLAAGASAPEFQLRNVDGGAIALGELLERGPLVLVFFKISCPVCQFTMPFLDRIYRAEARGSLQMFGVSQDDDSDTKSFLSRYMVTFPSLLDEPHKYLASNAYGITHVPTTFVVEKDGSISHSWSGFSKKDMERLGARVALDPFRQDEYVPAWKAG